MAVAIESLLDSYEEPKLGSPKVMNEAVRETGSRLPVLFFFFKRGDDETQLTEAAISSLLTQLLHYHRDLPDATLDRFLKILEADTSAVKPTPMNLEDSEMLQEEMTADEGPALKHPLSGELSENPVENTLSKMERIMEILKKPVYIVVDGIDECTDHQTSGLVQGLIRLGRSKKASFKILMSSRVGLDLERLFVETEGKEVLKLHDTNIPSDCAVHSVWHQDTAILTVTKSSNEDDMKAYLADSLTELLNQSLSDIAYVKNITGAAAIKTNEKQAKDIKKMVEAIQKKADGMFTYSAMTIASLKQPSPLSIKQRIRRLPDQMDSLYARHLESLTAAQRKLVILALNRVISAPEEVNVLEIIEQFKQEYVEKNEKDEMEDTDESENEEKDGLHNKSTFKTLLEDPMEIAMRRPEIIYTIYQLEMAGREFFRFSLGRRKIDLVHKSVRDWVEKESKKAGEQALSQIPLADVVELGDFGELKFTLPRQFIEGNFAAKTFRSVGEIHLDILIYILETVISEKFRRRYMPLYELTFVDNCPSGTISSSAISNEDSKNQGDAMMTNDEDPAGPKLDNPSLVTKTPQITNLDSGIILTIEEVVSENKDTDMKQWKAASGVFPVRGEFSHFGHHMKKVAEHWPREKRQGRKWNELRKLLRKFSQPDIFKRWSIQWRLSCNDELVKLLERDDYRIPGIVAAGEGWEIYLEFLLEDTELNYDFSARSTFTGMTVLHKARITFFPDLLERVILKVKENITAEDTFKSTPLHGCVTGFDRTKIGQHEAEYIQSIKILLKYDPAPDFDLEKTGQPYPGGLLYYAMEIGDFSLLELAFEKYLSNANATLTSETGRTLLHNIWGWNVSGKAEIENLRIDFVRKLLKAGFDPNAQDTNSTGPLYPATVTYNERGVELLLEWGANVNDDDVSGRTALTGLILLSRDENIPKVIPIVKTLKSFGADLNLRTKSGGTALMFSLAGCSENLDLVKLLLELHAAEDDGGLSYLKQRDIGENGLFHKEFIQSKGPKTLKLLIDHLVLQDPNPDIALEILELKMSGETIMDFARYRPWSDARAHLIWVYYLFGRTDDGKSFKTSFRSKYYITRILEDPETLKILKYQYGEVYRFFVETRPYNTWFLGLAISTKQFEAIEELASHHVDPFQVDDEGWDAFDWAYSCDQLASMQRFFPHQLSQVDYLSRKANRTERFSKTPSWNSKHAYRFVNISEDGVVQTQEDVHGKQISSLQDFKLGCPSEPY
ncbi:hypothetical protein ABW20_dc0105486 [Dactylellina cionopaga]|nr:hypothetical protein ABW20_dc0105486 [Dactylellina cionopaga]